jgi:hypothetical protein
MHIQFFVGRSFIDHVIHERILLNRILKDYFHLHVKPGHGKGKNSRILGTYEKNNINELDEKYRTLEGRRKLGRLPER